MKSKSLVTLALFSFALGLHAAPESEKTRQVRTLLVQEHWIPEYVTNKMGFLVPGEPKPHEIPPTNLAIRNEKSSDPVGFRFNVVGDPKKVRADRVDFGLEEETKSNVVEKGKADAKSTSGKTKEKPTFKPLFTLPLPGADNLICIYPKPKNDWRQINRLVIALDEAKAENNKVLVINVSAFPLAVRSATGQPLSLKSGGHAFIPRNNPAENKLRIQAIALMNGQQRPVANTAINTTPDQLPVLTFLNADPESGNCGVDFLKDAIPYPPPPEPADKAVAKK